MMNWLKIKNYHRNPPAKNVFVRRPEIQSRYNQHLAKLKGDNVPLVEYIDKKYLKSRLKWIIVDNLFFFPVRFGAEY